MKWLTFLFIVAGCSVNNLKSSNRSDRKSLQHQSSKMQNINTGPSLSNSSFKDETELYGLGHIKAANFFIIDFNQDGYSDIVFLPEYYSAPQILLFEPKEKIFKPLDYSPFEQDVKAHYLLFYDFNNDHLLDVLVGVLNQKSELKKIPLELHIGRKQNGKLHFVKDPTAITLPASAHASVAVLDYDLDGDLDLFVANWFDQSVTPIRPLPDILLTNNQGKFSNASELLVDEWKKDQDGVNFLRARPSYATSICDINQDGYIDILTSSTNGYGNKLWLNSSAVRSESRFFTDTSVLSRFSADSEGLLTSKGGGRTFSVVCSDYNNDSIMDVFVGEIYHNYDPDNIDRSSILTGSTTKRMPEFIRTEYTLDSMDISWHQADRRAVWWDYNLDGLLDLLIDNSGYPPHTKMVLFEQLSDHSFISRASDLGLDFTNPTSTVLIDVNRDGRWDVLSASSDLRDASLQKRVYLLVNYHEPVGKSLKLHLEGDKANTLGVGATLILKLSRDGKYYQRIYNVEYSQGGLPPQNESSLILGIAPGEKLREIIVRWPYAIKKDTKTTLLERTYRFSGKLGPEYTLCEAGYFLEGNKRCGL